MQRERNVVIINNTSYPANDLVGEASTPKSDGIIIDHNFYFRGIHPHGLIINGYTGLETKITEETIKPAVVINQRINSEN